MAKKKQRGGRKSPLDRELVDRIVERIRGCYYQKTAIESLGYTERVLHKWKARGDAELKRMEDAMSSRARRGEEMFVLLVRELKKAQAEQVIRHAANIQRNALGQDAKYATDKDGNIRLDQAGHPILLQQSIPSDWKASSRYLESVDHIRWGRRVSQELSVPEDAGPSELRITVVDKRKVKRRKKSTEEE